MHKSEIKPNMEEYFNDINTKVAAAYKVAEAARSKGYDPERKVDIPLTKSMAERVVALVGSAEPKLTSSIVVPRINELEKMYGKLDWRVALQISLEVAQEKFCSFESKIKAMETGIRIGLAYLTLGIVASPLEGFVELKLKKTKTNKDYFCIMYAGPIRSAGGTAGAVSVLIADYIRKSFGYEPYDPDDNEVERMVTELYDYHERITNLQYLPSEKEIKFLVKNIPVQIDGDPSEDIEVSNYKDVGRISTNRIRSGSCLVLGECIAQKSSKLWAQLSKWKSDFGMEHWDFLQEFVELQKSIKSKKKGDEPKGTISPDYTFIKDLVAGRPILTYPLREGGFRLRYGRCRNTGYSSAAIHPATMNILNNYIAIGTQLKLERPGKAAAISVCDSIDGPVVKLKNGSVQFLDTEQKAKQYKSEVEEIIYLGDILISYGDFYNRAHVLVPPGYCEEWWAREVEASIKNMFGTLDFKKLWKLTGIAESRLDGLVKSPLKDKPDFEEALVLSSRLNVPLHPIYIFFWNAISTEQLAELIEWLSTASIEYSEDKIERIILKKNEAAKRALELIGVQHTYVSNEFTVVNNHYASALALSASITDKEKIENFLKNLKGGSFENSLSAINYLSPVKIRDKLGIFIGARMGRPEKAKIRKMTGDPHILFPVGEEGGKMRSLNAAINAGKITAEFPTYICNNCNKETIFSYCEACSNETVKVFYCKTCGLIKAKCLHNPSTYRLKELDIINLFSKWLDKIGIKEYPDIIKGVRGTSNRNHIPEHFIKGILRARNKVYVNKDGTIRYDITQLPITHFKSKEVGTSVESLRKLGYKEDIYGEELVGTDQVLELRPQDVILPACTEAAEDGSDKVLFNVANFIDELLVHFYGMEQFYNLKSAQDLVGHLVITIAPHTSAAIVGRIVGFSKTQCFYAHPMLHAANRRDCDGDELSVILLIDALLNFSRQFLPNTRGATQDAPLVLTSIIEPSEVDDMLFDLDIDWNYPLEFYESCLELKQPSKVPIERFGLRLNTDRKYYGLGYTHDISNIDAGVRCSSYKILPSMEDKLKGQMELADKIRAVDAADVARLVIEKHLIRDIKGNLRKFSTQQFRCSKCNEKYRRPPLIGKCLACGNRIIFTVTEGAIIKYLRPALSLADHYNLPSYVKQMLELTKENVEETFGKDKEKQEGLGRWFG